MQSAGLVQSQNCQGRGCTQLQVTWMDGSESRFDAAWLQAHDYSDASLAHRALRASGRLPPTAAAPLHGANLTAAHAGELPDAQEELVDWAALHSLFPLPDSQSALDDVRCSPVPEAGRTGQLAQHNVQPVSAHRSHSTHADAPSADATELAVAPQALVPTAEHDAVMSSTASLHQMLQDLNQ